MASFRDRFFTPKVATAITSPSAIVAAGAGAAVGMVAGGPLGAIFGGALLFAARVWFAIPRKEPSPTDIDPFTLSDPWRRLVQDALSAEREFDAAIGAVDSGPLRDRLDTIGERVQAAVMECWEVALAGHSVAQARKRIKLDQLRSELDSVKNRGYVSDAISGTAEALEAQLDSAERMDTTITESRDRLQLLNARLDEAVTRSIELSASSATGDPQFDEVGHDLSDIVTEMEAYRQALDAVNRPDGSTGSAPAS